MRKLIIILAVVPLIVIGQDGRFKNLTVYDTLTIQDTAVVVGLPGSQITDSTLYMEETNSGNYYDLKLSSFAPPSLDYYAEESTATYYIGGGHSLNSLYFFADSGNLDYQFSINPTYNRGNSLELGTSNAFTVFRNYMDQRDGFRNWYVEFYPTGNTAKKARIDLDAEFFRISLNNTEYFNVDTSGLVEFDSLTDGTRSEAVSDVIYPSHGWARFDSTIVIPVTQNVYTIVTNTYDSLFRAAHLRGVVDVSGDTIILGSKSHFAFNYAVTFSGTANDEYIFRVMLDGSELFHVPSTTSNVSQRNSISLPIGVNADAGSRLWVEVTNTASGDDPTIYSGSWYIFYLHRLE